MSFFHGGVLQKIYKEVADRMESAGVEKFKKEHAGREPHGQEVSDIRQEIVEKTDNAVFILSAIATQAYQGEDCSIMAGHVAAAGKQAKSLMSDMPAYEGAILDATIDSAVGQIRNFNLNWDSSSSRP